MTDKFLDCALAFFVSVAVLFVVAFMVAFVYDGVTGDWRTRVVEVNNPEKRVVCFRGSHDKSGTCYPYELLDKERIKKYEEMK